MGDTWEPGGVATDTTDTTDTTRVAPQLLLGLRCGTPTIFGCNMLHPNYSGVANVTPQPLTTLTTYSMLLYELCLFALTFNIHRASVS